MSFVKELTLIKFGDKIDLATVGIITAFQWFQKSRFSAIHLPKCIIPAVRLIFEATKMEIIFSMGEKSNQQK